MEEKDSDRERFHSDPAVQAYSRESTPSPPTSDDEPDEVERGSPISQSPASPTVDAVEEMATMTIVTHLASSAPPPPPHPHTQHQPDTSQTTPPPLQTAATTAGSQPPYPPPPQAGYNTTTSSSSSSTYPPAPQTYPPPNTSYNTTAYPHTNTTPNTGKWNCSNLPHFMNVCVCVYTMLHMYLYIHNTTLNGAFMTRTLETRGFSFWKTCTVPQALYHKHTVYITACISNPQAIPPTVQLGDTPPTLGQPRPPMQGDSLRPTTLALASTLVPHRGIPLRLRPGTAQWLEVPIRGFP